MAYSFARDEFGYRGGEGGGGGGGVNTVPYQSTNMLGVTRNTTEPVFLSGSRIETTPGYVELNTVNVYDKANHYDRNKPSAPTKTSSISQNINPYGWFDQSLATTRRTPDIRDEIGSVKQPYTIDNTIEHRSERSDRRLHSDGGFSDIGRTRQALRESTRYADNVRTDRSEHYTSREISQLRQTVQQPPEINVHTPETPVHVQTELGRTQLRSTMLKATTVDDDTDENPFGWQVLGPTLHHPATNSVQQAVGENYENKTDNIYTSRIHSEANLPPLTNQFSNYKFGDTLMPPKRQITGTNLGQTMTGTNLGQTMTGTNLRQTMTGTNLRQTMTYDYPYMKHVRRSSEEDMNVSSQKWITMATDHAYMRWLHIMFAKFRSKWGKGESSTKQPLEPYRRQRRIGRRRHRDVDLYSFPERACIGLIVTGMIILATLVPVLLIRSYKQDPPKLRKYTLECTLRNFPYVDTLGNQSSEEFINTSQSFCNEIDNAILPSSIDIEYVGCMVDDISSGSKGVRLTFSVILRPYRFIYKDEILPLLGLVAEHSVINLGHFVLSSNINIQPFIIIEDKNNPSSNSDR